MEGRRERFESDVSLWGTNLAVRTSYFYANIDYYNLVIMNGFLVKQLREPLIKLLVQNSYKMKII